MSHLNLSTQGPQRYQNAASSVTSLEASQLSAYFIQKYLEMKRNVRKGWRGLPWTERLTEQSSVSSYSQYVCHAVSAFMELLEALHHHRRGLYLEKTDCVLRCGRKAGIWRMLQTYNPSFLRPVLYFETLKGLKMRHLHFLSIFSCGYKDAFTPTLKE